MTNQIQLEHPCGIKDPCFEGLKHIGYWYPSPGALRHRAWMAERIQGYRPPKQDAADLLLPKVEDAIDITWDQGERQTVVAYLKAGRVNYSYDGWSECRICGEGNGSHDLTDGTWGWPEGYAHYVEHHGVKPPTEFIQHVLKKAT